LISKYIFNIYKLCFHFRKTCDDADCFLKIWVSVAEETIISFLVLRIHFVRTLNTLCFLLSLFLFFRQQNWQRTGWTADLFTKSCQQRIQSLGTKISRTDKRREVLETDY